MTSIDIDHLRETIARMEEYLASDDSAVVQELIADYGTLKIRFARDLADERDVLLSCGGALMLVQQFGQRHHDG